MLPVIDHLLLQVEFALTHYQTGELVLTSKDPDCHFSRQNWGDRLDRRPGKKPLKRMKVHKHYTHT